jgi:hypothetical protein
MSSQIDGNFRTFLVSSGYTGSTVTIAPSGTTTANGIPAYLAVTVNSDGTITPANTAISNGVGILQEDVQAGQYGKVKLWTGAGTFLAAVSGTAVTPGTGYAIITGGYIGTASAAGGYTAGALAIQSGVASNGIVLEFVNQGF